MIAHAKTAFASVIGRVPLNGSLTKVHNWIKFSQWCNQKGLTCSFQPDNDSRFLEAEKMLNQENLSSEVVQFLEFGVCHGDWLFWWAKQLPDNRNSFVGFDSFTGLPEQWNETTPAKAFSRNGQPPHTSDPRISFEIGWFHKTLPGFLASFERKGKLILRLDADLYSSTLQVLMSFGHLLQPGDILMFDEFADPSHEFRAFRHFIDAFHFQYSVISAPADLNRIAFKFK